MVSDVASARGRIESVQRHIRALEKILEDKTEQAILSSYGLNPLNRAWWRTQSIEQSLNYLRNCPAKEFSYRLRTEKTEWAIETIPQTITFLEKWCPQKRNEAGIQALRDILHWAKLRQITLAKTPKDRKMYTYGYYAPHRKRPT